MRTKWILLVVFASVVTTQNASPQARRWVLPVADGGPEPSPPSVHGYLLTVSPRGLTIQRDRRDKKVGSTVTVQFTPRTDFFSAFGGSYRRDQLRSSQYVWVWYVTADPAQAGTPPRAAVVMLWSKDPDDKPSEEVRWSFDEPQRSRTR